MSIRTELLAKAKREYEGSIEYIKGKSPEKVIECALEIVVKQELMSILEHEKELSDETLEIIHRFYLPLDMIYSEWLSQDTSTSRDNLIYAIEAFAKINTMYQTPEDMLDDDGMEM